MSVQGLLSSMSMADLIQWARTTNRSGMIVVRDAQGREERRLVLEKGRIVACSSNVPREQLGRYFIHFGICTAEEIDSAIATQRQTKVFLGALLVSKGRISERQVVAILEEKTIESVTDVFLWREGSFHYDPKPVPIANLVRIEVDPINLALEGCRRADEWGRLRTLIHPASVYERTGEPLLPEAEVEDRRTTELVLAAIDGDSSVQDIYERLPWSRYTLFRSLADLIAHGVIRSGDGTAVADRKKRFELRLAEARLLRQNDRWGEALEILEGLNDGHPGRAELEKELAETGDGFRRQVYEEFFEPTDVPFLTIAPEALSHLRLSPADGFVLSRIDGRITVAHVLRISPVRDVQGLRILLRLLEAKVIGFPTRKG